MSDKEEAPVVIEARVNATMPAMVVNAVGVTRMHFTGQHLMAAAAFSRRVGEVEQAHVGEQFGPFFDEILWNASACIMLSTAAIESYLNELIADRAKHFTMLQGELLDSFWANHERASLLDKFDLALMLRGEAPLDRGAEPTESMNALVTLRNELVHFKPEWSDESRVHARVSRKLASKVQPSPFLPGEELFPRAWATHSCTKWAVESAVAFGSHVKTRFGLTGTVFDKLAHRFVP